MCREFSHESVNEFWKSVYICESYYQTSSDFLFWYTIYKRGPMPSCGVLLSVLYPQTQDSHTILVFPHQTWQFSDENSPRPNGGVECRWGYDKNRYFRPIVRFKACSKCATVRCCKQSAGPWAGNGGVCWSREMTKHHASMNLVYDRKP